MKLITSLAVLLLSVGASAFPVNPDSDWKDIFGDRQSKVTVDYNMGGQNLNNVCVNSQEGLQSINPVPVCLEYQKPTKCSPVHWPCDRICLKPAEQIIEIARDYTVTYCAKFRKPLNAHYPDCDQEATEQVHIPDVVDADVYRLTGRFGGESGNSYFNFTKSYKIPSCQ